MLKVLVKIEDFEEATPKSTVYGLLDGKSGCHVRCELGEEIIEYIPNYRDDEKTLYRLFLGCTTKGALNILDLYNNKYLAKKDGLTIKIYY